MTYHYVWLVWSSAFLLPWVLLYALFPQHRVGMLWASVFMAPFGLTEPIFVPEYWNPPSLFELAQRTGFDLESIIFSFAIGGIGAVLYNTLTRKHLAGIDPQERHGRRHRWHRWALAVPFASFPILYFLPWNPVYAGIAAMVLGAIAAVLCRPDLKADTRLGGVLFLALYSIFLLGLKWSAPGYIEQVWNLKALSGIVIYGLPIEELMFGFSFGLVWTGIYEHFTWKRGTHDREPVTRVLNLGTIRET
jgi:Lycopene cyclase